MRPEDIYDYHTWFTNSFRPLLGARFSTTYQALMVAVARGVKTIVETGTARALGNWQTDGKSTVVLAAFAQRYGCKLWSCDIDAAAIATAREATLQFTPCVEFVLADSVVFLRDFKQPIDFLYLDSMDFDDQYPDESQNHALAEAQAAVHALHTQSILLVDDCNLPHGGKGGKVIPFFLGEGWHVIGLNYQVLMTHVFSGEIMGS